MKTNEANEMRLLAAEIIRQLYEAKQRRQLELLELQVKRSLEELNTKVTHGGDSRHCV